MPDDVTYGATPADVKALLPHRRWTAGTKPDEADVARYLTSIASTLNISAPLPVDPDVRRRLEALCRRAVVLGAAAEAEAAANPERARPNETSSYATWLLERYQEAVEKAEVYAEEIAAGNVPGIGDVDADPAWSFPDPASFALRGI